MWEHRGDTFSSVKTLVQHGLGLLGGTGAHLSGDKQEEETGSLPSDRHPAFSALM